MRLQEQLSIHKETKSQNIDINGLVMQFVREVERIVPRNDFTDAIDVRDLLPDVVLPLGDIWPARRTYIWQRQVRQVCPGRCIVYVIRSPADTLYVGVTSGGLHRRIAQHFHSRTELGLVLRYAGIEVLDYMTEQYLMPDRSTALRYETQMIQYRSPSLNITHNASFGKVTRMPVAS